MEVATLASRITLKVINKSIKGNPLISWKGSSFDFMENGYKTSPRYEESLDKLREGCFDYYNPDCKCCNKKDS